MSRAETCLVEFIGGPFDGHVQTVSYAAGELNEIAVLPVNDNILQWINGLPQGARKPASSLAVYSLAREGDELRYVFLGPTTPTTHQQCDWLG